MSFPSSPTLPPSPPPSLLFFLLCSASLLLAVVGLNSEGTALLSLKSAIRDDPYGSLDDWASSDQTPCYWNGITCRDGSVVALSLRKKKLVGFLPAALGSLQSLRHVNLRNNRFFGHLPVGLFAARGLQSLVLTGNFLSGSIPPEIGGLSYLQSLDLSGNSFSGSIPTSLLGCKRLKTLILSRNKFTNALLRGFGSNLAGLERLDLSYNGFNGSIPNDLGELINLQGTLDLSHNHFFGSIPSLLGNLPEKVYVDISYNNLSGPIPQFGALANRGPAAFIGNPDLCGLPLKKPCSSHGLSISSPPPQALEGNDTYNGKGSRKVSSKGAVAAIVVGDVVGIGMIALLFFYFYRRTISSFEIKEDTENSNKGWKSRKLCICCRKELEASYDSEQCMFVPLDKNFNVGLDELLKASTFVLGKSEIGIVYKVVLDDGLALAVRRLEEGGLQTFEEFHTEVETIGKVQHTNIVSLKAYYWSIDEKLLIYDYIANGNLSTAIHVEDGTKDFVPLSWEVRLKIMKGIANGLAFLHDFSPQKYIHGNLKPNNILLGLNMEPYICDFGVGRLANIAGGSPFLQSDRVADEKTRRQQTGVVFSPIISKGSPFLQSDRVADEKTRRQQTGVVFSPIISKGSLYQAPEMLKTLKPSQKWDVYSYGVILLELISGLSPLVLLETAGMDLVQWVHLCIEQEKTLLEMLDPFLAQAFDREDDATMVLKIALACVQANAEKRPTMRYIADSLKGLNTKGRRDQKENKIFISNM